MSAEVLPQRPSEISDASPPVAQLLEWRPWVRSADSRLAGHATIAFAGGWHVAKIPIFRAPNDDLSVGVPSIVELDGEGRAKTRADAGRLYQPIITFANTAAKLRWQRVVLAALAASGVIP